VFLQGKRKTGDINNANKIISRFLIMLSDNCGGFPNDVKMMENSPGTSGQSFHHDFEWELKSANDFKEASYTHFVAMEPGIHFVDFLAFDTSNDMFVRVSCPYEYGTMLRVRCLHGGTCSERVQHLNFLLRDDVPAHTFFKSKRLNFFVGYDTYDKTHFQQNYLHGKITEYQKTNHHDRTLTEIVKSMIPTVKQLKHAFQNIFISSDNSDDVINLNLARGHESAIYNIWMKTNNTTNNIPRTCMDYDVFQQFKNNNMKRLYNLLRYKSNDDAVNKYIKQHTGM
jgi:hypothetical protein